MERKEHLHEIVSPIREIVRGIGTWALDKIIPADAISDMFNGIQQESAHRTVQTYSQLTFDSEGNWHNPDGI